MLKELVGCGILAILVALFYLALPNGVISLPVLIFTLPAWIVIALFIWRHPRSPSRPREWVYMMFVCLGVGVTWCGFSLIIGRMVFSSDMLNKSDLIDILIGFAFVPGMMFVAAAGAVRALFDLRASGESGRSAKQHLMK
jgi:hypothetical protein